MYEKQKISPDNYTLKGTLQVKLWVIHNSIPVTISIQLPEIPEGHQTPSDTSSSCSKLQWLPCLGLPVTSPCPEAPAAQWGTGIANSSTWSYPFSMNDFVLYTQNALLFTRERRKSVCSPAQGNAAVRSYITVTESQINIPLTKVWHSLQRCKLLYI